MLSIKQSVTAPVEVYSVEFNNLENASNILTVKKSYPVLTVEKLIDSIDRFISQFDNLVPSETLTTDLQLELDKLKFYFNNPNFVTGAVLRGGLASLRKHYSAELLRISLKINPEIKAKELKELTSAEAFTLNQGTSLLAQKYKVKQAYASVLQGKKFQKAGLTKDLVLTNPIQAQSKRNIRSLIKYLKLHGDNKFGLRNDELELFSALLNLPYKLQHATNAYYPILNSGGLDSYTEIRRRDSKYISPYSTKGNVTKLGNDGFVFFRLYVDPINSSQTRYGDTSILFDVNLLRQCGWISLHDQLKPFPAKSPGATRCYRDSRLIRMAETIGIYNKTKDRNLHDGILYKYRVSPIINYTGTKDTQKVFGPTIQVKEEKRSFLEEIFYGSDILLGIALSIIRELRCLEASNFRRDFLQTFNNSSNADKINLLGNLIKDLFRIEGKYPVSLKLESKPNSQLEFTHIADFDNRLSQDLVFQVINPDGDGRYNLDLSINNTEMEFANLKIEEEKIKVKLSNLNRQRAKLEKNCLKKIKEKSKNLNQTIEELKEQIEQIKEKIKLATQHKDRIINALCNNFECKSEIFNKTSSTKLEIINDYYIEWIEAELIKMDNLLELPLKKLILIADELYYDLILNEDATFEEIANLPIETISSLSKFDLSNILKTHNKSFTELVNLYNDPLHQQCLSLESLLTLVSEACPKIEPMTIKYLEDFGILDEIIEGSNYSLSYLDQMIFNYNLIQNGCIGDDYENGHRSDYHYSISEFIEEVDRYNSIEDGIEQYIKNMKSRLPSVGLSEQLKIIYMDYSNHS